MKRRFFHWRGIFFKVRLMLFCAAWQGAALAQSVAVQSPAVPAVLDEPDPAVHLELQAVVVRLLHVPSALIADDALVNSSLMVIEKNRPRDALGLQLSGRDFDVPEHFQLMKVDERCVLVHLRTGMQQPLCLARCRAVPTASTPP